MRDVREVPKSVQHLASYFFIGAIVMGASSLSVAMLFLLAPILLSLKLAEGWALDVLTKLVLSITGLALAFLVERWGLLKRKRWAYYICRIVFVPSFVNSVLLGRDDWIAERLKSQEARQWFFEESV